MISSNIADVIKSLDLAIKDITSRLRFMVMLFSYDVVGTAINKTPIGDAEKYADFYTSRRGTGLPEYEGLAKFNWQYSEANSFPLQTKFAFGSDVKQQALQNFKQDFSAFKLGDSFYIGNDTPYIGMLEDNHSTQTAGRGIMQPTVQDVMGIYQFNLQEYFNRKVL